MRHIYLHGFASRPASRKATYFHTQFLEHGIDLTIPALDGANFPALTVSGQLEIVQQAIGGQESVLIGSSLGGYLAALAASRNSAVKAVVLLAPAFCFPRRWEEELGADAFAAWESEGSREVFHYGEGRPMRIGFGLIRDGLNYEDYPDVEQRALVLHGVNDDVVPVAFSREFSRRHPQTAELIELDTDHEMASVLPDLWNHTRRFLFP